jgi:hypothetical protein
MSTPEVEILGDANALLAIAVLVLLVLSFASHGRYGSDSWALALGLAQRLEDSS